MRSWRWYSKVLFALLVVAYAYWVWPTPWRDEGYVTNPSGVQMEVRLRRITGRAQFLSYYGWEDQQPRPRPAP